ncbi:MAG: CoA-transferase, partial [Roseiarcus sp.]
MKKGQSARDAASLIPDCAVLMIGGFMAVGSRRRLIEALVEAGRKNLTVIANDRHGRRDGL